MKTIRDLSPYLRRHWVMIALGTGCQILTALIDLLPAFLIGSAVNAIGEKQPLGNVLNYIWLLLGVGAVSAFGQFGGRYFVASASRKIEYEMRSDFFLHLQSLDANFYKNLYTGDLMARATNDLNQIRNMLGPGLSGLLRVPLTFTAVVITMFTISVKLALIAVLLMPLVTVVFYLLNGRMRNQFEKVQAQFGELSTRVQENLNSIRVVKSYAQEEKEIKRFAGENSTYIKLNLVYVLLSGLLWPLLDGLLGVVTAIVLVVGGGEVVAGNIGLDRFVQFTIYLAQLGWPMIMLGWTMTLLQQGSASLKRINEVMHRQPQIKDEPERIAAGGWRGPVRGEIEFRNVTLTYDGIPALAEVSFQVPAGSTLAIVGATGSGKSSIVGLITRMYDPEQGQILIDGVDSRAIPLADLRRAIGYVPQDNFLFSLPLRENVAFGLGEADAGKQIVTDQSKSNYRHSLSALRAQGQAEAGNLFVTDGRHLPNFSLRVNLDDDPMRELRQISPDERERIGRAVEIARLSKDLEQFPAGLDTMIGERGVTLSGGQKQRSAIARAIVRDPAILILDDSLSSVDTQTASEILSGLKQVMAKRTSIIIAQRISTVQGAEQIIVLEDGRVVERGSHMALITQGGRYAAMYRRELLAQELDVEPEVAAQVS